MQAIQTIETAMTTMVRDHGNTPLPEEASPYRFQIPGGATIALYNNPSENQIVTYGTLLNAARSLEAVLIDGRIYHRVAFIIFEAGVHVGGGIIRWRQ